MQKRGRILLILASAIEFQTVKYIIYRRNFDYVFSTRSACISDLTSAILDFQFPVNSNNKLLSAMDSLILYKTYH